MTARSAAFARFFALLFVLSSSVAFVSHPTRWVEQSYAQRTNVHQALSMARIEVGYIGEIPNGERKIVDTSSGAVIVTNVDNKLYAVNAKCPHLGLPMKRGPVTSDADGYSYETCACVWLNTSLCYADLASPATSIEASLA
jgi:nitrite reductase/ring-hydroxylating ferredoxin subunit